MLAETIDANKYRQTQIGIAISGNPAHGNDRKRSATLRDFAPLLAMGDVFIVQRGLNAIDEGYLLSEPRLHNIGAEIDGFDQAAGVLSNLDLIISVDTGTAHLSAAMGKPTWLLLPSNCDWRWGLESDGTAWYPSMRLFRQEHAGDWVDPIRQMGGALAGRRALGVEKDGGGKRAEGKRQTEES